MRSYKFYFQKQWFILSIRKTLNLLEVCYLIFSGSKELAQVISLCSCVSRGISDLYILQYILFIIKPKCNIVKIYTSSFIYIEDQKG